jgi:hypothetical protein
MHERHAEEKREPGVGEEMGCRLKREKRARDGLPVVVCQRRARSVSAAAHSASVDSDDQATKGAGRDPGETKGAYLVDRGTPIRHRQ